MAPAKKKKKMPARQNSKPSPTSKAKASIPKKSKPAPAKFTRSSVKKSTRAKSMPSATIKSTPASVKNPPTPSVTLSAVTRSKALATQKTNPLAKEHQQPIYVFSDSSTGEESELSIIWNPKSQTGAEKPTAKKQTKTMPSIKQKPAARRKSQSLAESDDESVTTPGDFNFDIINTGLFMQKWILLDKIPIMPHSSPVYRIVTKDGIYGDLRCFTKKEHPRLNMEVMCLDKMEKHGKGHMFRKVCEMRMVNSEKDGFMTYVVTYHRPGIPLSNILSSQKILDNVSGTRFGIEMIEIVENLIKAKILMTDISPDHFVIDQYSSKLFLSNASSLVGSTERFDIHKNFDYPSWKGTFTYAPLRWHTEPDTPLTEGDLIESTFYVFLDMIGQLPWQFCQMDEVTAMKKKYNSANLNQLKGSDLHPSLITCLMIIRRGQLFDVVRTKDVSSTTILLHNFRKLGVKGKPVPTGAMMDYGAIYTAMRAFAGNGNAFVTLHLPVSLRRPAPDPARAALMDHLLRQKLERDALKVEIMTMQKIVTARQIHTKQLDAEVANNERFINKYVFQLDEFNVKEEQSTKTQQPVPQSNFPAEVKQELLSEPQHSYVPQDMRDFPIEIKEEPPNLEAPETLQKILA